MAALSPNGVALIKDVNGNHVIQRCLNLLPSPLNQFIYIAAGEHVVDISTHRHGCCVIQRCFDSASPTQKSDLVDKIIENAVILVQDAFGNYVVQYVLDMNIPEVNSRLAKIFIEQILLLAKQKFSSNVLEKCLQQNNEEVQMLMITEISKAKNIKEMLSDQYANYVVQRALMLAPRPVYVKMMKEIRPCMEELKRSAFGKKVYSKLVRKYPELVKEGAAWN